MGRVYSAVRCCSGRQPLCGSVGDADFDLERADGVLDERRRIGNSAVEAFRMGRGDVIHRVWATCLTGP
jgi:hypothetical protein